MEIKHQFLEIKIVKVSIVTEIVDTDNDDLHSNRFTPTTAGTYYFYANVIAEFDTDKLFAIRPRCF